MNYRLPTTTLSLPYTANELKMPVNKITDNNTFNEKISLLNDGYNTLLNYASIVDNNLPYNYGAVYYISTDIWDDTPYGVYEGASNHNFKHLEVITSSSGSYIYILAKEDSIYFYTGDELGSDETPTLFDFKEIYTQVKDRGDQYFKNITAIRYYNNILYVYDDGYDNIIAYNIQGILTGDNVTKNIQKISQYTHFSNVIDLVASEDIYVITDNELYQMNSSLNIKTSVSLSGVTPISIDYDSSVDKVYILGNDGSNNYIYIYTGTCEFVEKMIVEKIESDEEMDTIRLSKTNEDLIYIQSNKYVYKMDKATSTLVGYFKLNGALRDKLYLDISTKSYGDFDEVFLLDENKIHYFRDKVQTIDLYDTDNILNALDITELTIHDLEMEQDFVYNSALQKVLFNNILLYNSIIYKAVVETDVGGVLTFNHLESLVNTDENLSPLDAYGLTEVAGYNTFNRAFGDIRALQIKILELLEFIIEESSTNTLIIN